MKTIAFFNNRSGAAKSWLIYNLAWMYSDLGISVIAADLDPQANLTSMFLDEDRLAHLLREGDWPQTVHGVIRPIAEGDSNHSVPHIEDVFLDSTPAITVGKGASAPPDSLGPTLCLGKDLGLLPGDLDLSLLEEDMSDAWRGALHGDSSALRALFAFRWLVDRAGAHRKAELALIDVGSNLGATTRATLIAADETVIPISPDLRSLQAVKSLGLALRRWRHVPSDAGRRGARRPRQGCARLLSGLSRPRPRDSQQSWCYICDQ